MKIFKRIMAWLGILIVLAIIYVLTGFGYMPGLSKVLGTQKPKDLGITYTAENKTSAREKSQLVYLELPANTSIEQSIVRSGSRPVTTSWDSAEMTALMNDRPWRYWPIKEVQLRIDDDGTAELSGVVIKEKLKNYAVAIGVPREVAKGILSLLPANSAFYVKAKTSLAENKVKDFDIQAVSYGKISIPVNLLLSRSSNDYVDSAVAVDEVSELSKYSGKKAAIINFINDRLSQITGFYAKSAYFKDGKLNFDGTLSETEATVR